MNIKKLFSERRFLNKGIYHSLSAVSATYGLEEDDSFRWSPFKAEFSISDCNRSITLDIDHDDMEELTNSIYKLQQIEDVVKGLKEALIENKPALLEWLKQKEIKKQKEDGQEKIG